MEAHQLTDVDPEHFRALIEAADASAAVEEVPPQSLASSLSRCEDELDPTAAQAQPSTPNNNPASVFSPAAGETFAASALFTCVPELSSCRHRVHAHPTGRRRRLTRRRGVPARATKGGLR